MDVLRWITSRETQSPGLERMRGEFRQMLDAAARVFGDAADAFLGHADVAAVRDRVFATDKTVNKAERRIRKEIVVHESVHHGVDFVRSLVLMSILKDAERLGDYGKNLCDLAELSPERPSGTHRQHLTVLKDRLIVLFRECREVLESHNEEKAKEILRSATALEDRCDEAVKRLIRLEDDAGNMAAPYALAYRYFKRIAAHLRNITSSVVQPVHKLDFTSKITGRPEERE